MQQTYGGAEVLELVELPAPEAGPGTVPVRVHASSVNPFDWKLRAGYLRDFVTPTFPLVPGMDVAGVVDAVGPDVTEFAPGDEVVGYLSQDGVPSGASAEMVVAPTGSFVAKPESVDFRRAAALPQAGLSAAQLVADGELHVEIAEVFPLEQLGAAHERVAAGHVRGKVVVDLT